MVQWLGFELCNCEVVVRIPITSDAAGGGELSTYRS